MTFVAISGFACVLSIATNVVVARRVQEQLTSIRARYLPKVDLEPQLNGQWDALRRAFQDAVSSRDLDTLGPADEARRHLLERLDAARLAVDPPQAAALRASLDDYYTLAADVSRRMIAGETGEALVDEMASMQARQERVSKLIEKTASFDRQELDDAFAAVARAQSSATAYEIWISVGSLVSVLAISLALSRSLLGSFSALTRGFARFGEGDFSLPIVIARRDELADVAKRANSMATNLDALARERDRAEAELAISNRELEAFSYSVAHDLRAPLRGINGYSQALVEDFGDSLNEEAKEYLERIVVGTRRMGDLIDALLSLSRVTRAELRREDVDLTAMASTVVSQLQVGQPERVVEFVGREGAVGNGDPRLLRAVLENLLGNAWKFTTRTESPRIEFGSELRDNATTYYVRDNGAGFDATYANKLFSPFQRLHRADDFPGTGIGLATVQRIINRHGGRIWAEGHVGRGATFFFTLGPLEGR
jgi:signal transduction histidine kinase